MPFMTPLSWSCRVPRSYAEAVESLEQTAVGSKGSALLTTISDWCNALESMRQTGLGSINCPGATKI